MTLARFLAIVAGILFIILGVCCWWIYKAFRSGEEPFPWEEGGR